MLNEHLHNIMYKNEIDTLKHFSLATACYVFTKVLRQLVEFWGNRDVKMVVHLDDGIGSAKGADDAKAASDLVKSTWVQAGFVADPEKGDWDAGHTAKCMLGFIVDLFGIGLCVSTPREDCSSKGEARVCNFL